MENSTLRLRWSDDFLFREILHQVLLTEGNPSSMSIPEWFASKKAPLIDMYLSGMENLDCRCVNLNDRIFGSRWLNYIFDMAALKSNTYIETMFQGGTAKQADFSGSRFVRAQMSPYYATGASFERCTFIKSFLFGATAGLTSDNENEMFFGVPTDLTNCRFDRAIGIDTDFARCDLRGADLTEAYFEDCRFDESDLRGVKFESTRFVKCNFANAWLSDTAENRALVARGENKNIEQIHWKPVNS